MDLEGGSSVRDALLSASVPPAASAPRTLSGVLAVLAARARSLSWLQLITLSLVCCSVVTGSTIQVIALNFWLEQFPNGGGGPFTVLTVSSLCFVIVFSVSALATYLWERPSLAFLCERRAIALLVGIGALNALNGVTVVYATGLTPEFMQAVLYSTATMYTLGFSKLLLHDTRAYLNVYVCASMALLVAGVMVSAIPYFGEGSAYTQLEGQWTVVFAGSFIFGGLFNVLQTVFMRTYTVHGNASSVKSVMLFGSCVVQLACMFALLPMDALPWWGSSPTVAASWENLKSGWNCITTCEGNMQYFLLFNFGYVLSYGSTAILNKYSAPLASMLGQLNSPVVAVLLIVVPAWNVDGGTESPGASAGAIVLILAGTLLYAVWEEISRAPSDEEPVKHIQ